VANRTPSYVVRLDTIGRSDVAQVGGKNASLGELMRSLKASGVRVPPGFATTADAYRAYVDANRIGPTIATWISDYKAGRCSLPQAGNAIRQSFLSADFPADIANQTIAAYRALCNETGTRNVSVAVRSSATAEDLPEASFAGQQESFLNVRGDAALLAACRKCLASLFTDRAIAYREDRGFAHAKVALSVGVQQMVRADRGSAGVMFTIDTDSGFPDIVLINAAYGLGETVVKGSVDPDEYKTFKPFLHERAVRPIIERRLGSKLQKMVYARGIERTTRTVATTRAERSAYALTDAEVLQLSRWAVAIERHYGVAMDIEWAKDGETGDLYIVQARPETVHSRRAHARFQTFRLRSKGRCLAKGQSVGASVAAGKACRIDSPAQMDRLNPGDILVTGTTNPDWVPIMKRTAAIVTDHGGRTSHAAIVSRELGIPAVVGTGDATRVLRHDQGITVSCAEGEIGYVYDGIASYEQKDVDFEAIPRTRTAVMMNIANPAGAFRWSRLPSDGVGLTRIEFIISNLIKVHPLALTRIDEIRDAATRRRIQALVAGYESPADYFVERLALGVAQIAAALHPRPVIVRFSDFKTNEYANLVGGRQFEPTEENPMLGFRGASRYYSEAYRDGFALECRALRRVREEMGFRNVLVMIPFCRTVEEADRVLAEMAANGLERGRDGLEVYVMCEIPSNVLSAEEFAKRFDGFSIGSNDLTQLTLGVDRDSERLAALFDEANPAVVAMIRRVIVAAHKAKRKVGLCGQAPSDRPEFARVLVDARIDSISVSPDSFFEVKSHVAAAEARSKAGVDAHSKSRGKRDIQASA
jgi:pyruvate,water dikinase